ncbi:hypothetical protein OQA88_5972 [Cercophora sp. LCS_1]
MFSARGLQWIHTCTGQHAVLPSLPDDPAVASQPSSGLDLSLPPRTLAESYLDFFRKSHIKLEFPVIDTVMFQDTIQAAYMQMDGLPSPASLIARTCVLAFLSVVSFFEGENEFANLSADGNACALKAQHLLSKIGQDISLTTLQAMLMLSLHYLLSGNIPLSAMYHSSACRITFMLGGHVVCDPWAQSSDEGTNGLDMHARRHLRKLFWLCYTLDKEVSLRTGQPPCILDHHCDLTLPRGYLDIQYLDEYLFADAASLDETAVPILPGDLRLAMIKSKACRLLYSAEGLRKSDADLLRDIRELDEELERWRLSVPQKHRPVLSLSRNTSRWSEEDVPKSVRTVVITFEYHHLMTAIHQATGRCRAWAAAGSGEIGSVRSSLALAVEASRSTLLSLRSAVQGLLEKASWTIVFYPMSAVVTIFCNILWDPLNPRAQDDVELLRATPDLIRHIRKRRLTENEMLHLKVAENFLAELARLGQHAIVKAREEYMANEERCWSH